MQILADYFQGGVSILKNIDTMSISSYFAEFVGISENQIPRTS